MTNRQHLLLCFVLSFVCFSLAAPKASTQGQRTRESTTVRPSQDQTLQDLLKEVRQLRLAVERTNFNLFRAQVLVGRIRLQQDRIDRLTQQIEEIRTQSADNKSNQSRLQDRIKELDSRISQERDLTLRTQFESEQKEMKFLVEQQGAWEEQQRQRENQLSIQMQAEQEKLRRLNDRLDALEREFEIQNAPTSPSK